MPWCPGPGPLTGCYNNNNNPGPDLCDVKYEVSRVNKLYIRARQTRREWSGVEWSGGQTKMVRPDMSQGCVDIPPPSPSKEFRSKLYFLRH